MSVQEKRELTINSDVGGSISLERNGAEVSVTQTVFYANYRDAECPIVLETADRLALIDFLNMGEYRRLSSGEAR